MDKMDKVSIKLAVDKMLKGVYNSITLDFESDEGRNSVETFKILL
jgi:hypothetical protein